MKIKDKILSETSEEVKQRVRDTANKLVMKQETLEELSPMNDLLQDLKESKVSVKESTDIIEDEFIRGTVNLYVQTTLDNIIARIENELLEKELKWQQERSYSEEEVLELLKKALTHKDEGEIGSLVTAQGEIRTANFYSWFEQFKKK